MPLAWNEIRQRAIAFSREWSGAARARSESQSFYNDEEPQAPQSIHAGASGQLPNRSILRL